MSSSRKIQVLHIARRMSGGVRLHISQICTNLPHSIYDHHVVTNVEDSDASYRAKPLAATPVTDVPITHNFTISDLINIVSIVLRLRSKRFDIVHGHGAKGGLYARIVGRLCGAKTVYTPHGGIGHSSHYRWSQKLQTTVENVLNPLTDAYLFESNYAKIQFSKFVKHRQHRFYVNYNGLPLPSDYADPTPSALGAPIVIGAFGRLEYAKGFDLLISAIHTLITKHSLSLICRIYGEGDEYSILQKQIKELCMNQYAFLMGHSHNVLQDMASCDIIVQPSRFDSMPYVPLEAIHVGKPIIVTHVGGLPEIVTDGVNGLLVVPNVDDIASKIKRLCLDDLLRSNLVKMAYLNLEKRFSIDMMLQGIDSLYKSLISNSSRPS